MQKCKQFIARCGNHAKGIHYLACIFIQPVGVYAAKTKRARLVTLFRFFHLYQQRVFRTQLQMPFDKTCGGYQAALTLNISPKGGKLKNSFASSIQSFGAE